MSERLRPDRTFHPSFYVTQMEEEGGREEESALKAKRERERERERERGNHAGGDGYLSIDSLPREKRLQQTNEVAHVEISEWMNISTY